MASWGVGSGRSFTLGAMHTVWEKVKKAKDVAMAGITAGCKIDKISSLQAEVFTVRLKT